MTRRNTPGNGKDPGADGEDAGYRQPPKSTRFRKGRSGNPKGRPRGRYREAPYEAVLGQMVTVRDGGTERQMPAEEAFLLQLTKLGIEKGGAANRAALDTIEAAKLERAEEAQLPRCFTVTPIKSGNVTTALEALGLGRRLYPKQPHVRVVLEPWIVEAALARLGGRRLTRAQQQTVVETTRTPHKVTWPEWWEVLP